MAATLPPRAGSTLGRIASQDAIAVARVEPLTTARSLRGPFDYLRPDGVEVGSVLRGPVRRPRRPRRRHRPRARGSEHELAAPRRVLDESLPADLVALAPWMAAEYCSTPARALSLDAAAPRRPRAHRAVRASAGAAPIEAGERLTDRQRALLGEPAARDGRRPAALRRLEARGLVTIEPRGVRRAPGHVSVGARAGADPPPLTADQAGALAAIAAAAPGESLLLHGVTGSGKTEVYLRAAARDARRRAERDLVLVPGDRAHAADRRALPASASATRSRCCTRRSPGRRATTSGCACAAARRGSASGRAPPCFAPLERLGLIVVDEEHDASYKHEGDPRYDARHVAARRARPITARCSSPAARRRAPSPGTRCAGSRCRSASTARRCRRSRSSTCSASAARCTRATHEALVDARKSIVLLNRRGWSNYLTCRGCGRAWECPDCDVTLVLHRAGGTIALPPLRAPRARARRAARTAARCRSPATARAPSGWRPSCRAGSGVPARRRRRRRAGARSSPRFQAAERGVLVGTQMVAKGHDFPDVELGVVVDADATLRFPDFRAEERTFALVAQLAGRAGRGGATGRVIVQTLVPDAPAITLAARHDADELPATASWRRREALRYPPFSTLIRVVCSAAAAGRRRSGARRPRCARLLPGALGPGAAVPPARQGAQPGRRQGRGSRAPPSRRSARRSTPSRATARTAASALSASTSTRSSADVAHGRSVPTAGLDSEPMSDHEHPQEAEPLEADDGARARARPGGVARRQAALAHIVQFGDPVLQVEGAAGDRFDDALRAEIARMGGLMDDALGVGLAANQIGRLRRAARLPRRARQPASARSSTRRSSGARKDEEVFEEGCLSLPGVLVDVERPIHVRVRAQDGHGERDRRRGVGPRGARDPARDGPPRRRADPRPHLARPARARRCACCASGSTTPRPDRPRRAHRLPRHLGLRRRGPAPRRADAAPPDARRDPPGPPGGPRAQALVAAGRGRARASSASTSFQPEDVNAPSARRADRRRAPRRLLLCAYGALIKEPLLPTHEILNVHPSLLPRWRGAAPVERAIMAGDAQTGVDDHAPDRGLDSGPGLPSGGEPIGPDDDYGTLAARLRAGRRASCWCGRSTSARRSPSRTRRGHLRREDHRARTARSTRPRRPQENVRVVRALHAAHRRAAAAPRRRPFLGVRAARGRATTAGSSWSRSSPPAGGR